jgi:hypothetical protein
MCRVCPEYQRLSRAYWRAFIEWGKPGKDSADGAADADLEVLEKKFQFLTKHQQSCAVCSVELGQSINR